MTCHPPRPSLFAALTGLALAVAGPAAAQDVTIGALYLDAQGFYGGIKKGIETGAGDQNIRLLGQNSQGDASREAQFASTLISSQVQAIIMSPVSAVASVPVVRQAFDAGIPVICYNTCINDEDAQKYVQALVTTDQVKLGYDVGVLAAEYFVEKGIDAPRFGILNCDVYEACVQRKEGFKKAVEEKLPGVVWAADQAGFEPGKSTETATTMLTGDPEINAMFATTDNGTIGAVQGIGAAGRTGKVVVFGNDISAQLAQYLLNMPETLIATNGQQPQEMGRVSVAMALKAVKREKIDTYLTIVPTELFPSSDPDKVKEWLTAHSDGIP
ncbi:substrate-binding domain-containing protein [Paracoccus sp. (in: a-proteobacteria)]|uniref:substrate-binding domain-containing protein n=1 Tax=Paracoccus sp. TaxID=267 RepID=UPI003A856997